MSDDVIRYANEEGVAAISLNRPEVLNSFNRAMGRELQKALAAAASDDSVRAVLLTGVGRGFCAGQDLSEVLPKDGEPAPDLGDTVRDTYIPIVLALRNLAKPIVCAVNGVAAGAGANIALACDFVLASEQASFVQSFCKLGLVPDSGGTFFLPRLVGPARAAALTMLGDKVSAAEAQDLGLIYKTVPHESLMDEAGKLARRLAKQPTAGLALIKRALNQSLTNDLETQLQVERAFQTLAGQTHDYQEGVAAFLEKRKPNYTGK